MAGLAERSSLAHSLHYKEVCLTATVKWADVLCAYQLQLSCMDSFSVLCQYVLMFLKPLFVQDIWVILRRMFMNSTNFVQFLFSEHLVFWFLFLLLWPGFGPRSNHMWFVVYRIALGQVSSEYFSFSCQFSFHQLLHIP
jgi:hypothetical protein